MNYITTDTGYRAVMRQLARVTSWSEGTSRTTLVAALDLVAATYELSHNLKREDGLTHAKQTLQWIETIEGATSTLTWLLCKEYTGGAHDFDSEIEKKRYNRIKELTRKAGKGMRWDCTAQEIITETIKGGILLDELAAYVY